MTAFVMGPAPCQSCRQHVWWDGISWCDRSGRRHSCRQMSGLRRRWLQKALMIWQRAA